MNCYCCFQVWFLYRYSSSSSSSSSNSSYSSLIITIIILVYYAKGSRIHKIYIMQLKQMFYGKTETYLQLESTGYSALPSPPRLMRRTHSVTT